MRNTSKMTTLENKFPLLAVEQGCIISKDADITVAFEVELPELYTVTGAEYEAIHGCWCKAIKVLPDFSVVHKQDWFIKEKYTPERHERCCFFLRRRWGAPHFNERPYLKHTCYLYLTKTTKERNRMQSNFSTLCRGHIIPKELDKETAAKFMEAAEQFERIINDSGFVRLRRLSTDEIVGTDGKAGLIERYFSLMPEGDITDIYVTSFQKMLRDDNFTVEELGAIAFGYTKLLEESNDVLTELKNVVNITTLSMTDKERMDVVERCHSKMKRYRNLVSYYTNKNISVSYLRAKKKNDLDRIMGLYGSMNERYW